MPSCRFRLVPWSVRITSGMPTLENIWMRAWMIFGVVTVRRGKASESMSRCMHMFSAGLGDPPREQCVLSAIQYTYNMLVQSDGLHPLTAHTTPNLSKHTFLHTGWIHYHVQPSQQVISKFHQLSVAWKYSLGPSSHWHTKPF